MSINFLTIFNEQFSEFLNDVRLVFPDDVDVLSASNSLLSIKKINPKLLVKIWIKYVVVPYNNEITMGDISFFINKNYSTDLLQNDKSDKIMESIDRLRLPIKNMDPINQAKTMKYIQNLSKLALLVTP